LKQAIIDASADAVTYKALPSPGPRVTGDAEDLLTVELEVLLRHSVNNLV